MRFHKVKIPIYGGILNIASCESWKELKPTFFPDILNKYELDESCDGYVFDESNQFFVIFKNIPSGSVIAHEAVHLVNLLYLDRSIPLDIHNDEHQAYMIEWFFQQIENFFKLEDPIIRETHKPLIVLPRNNFTLRSNEKSWELKAFQSLRGLRDGNKRPDTLIIDCHQTFNAAELEKLICYLLDIKLAMQ